MYMFSNTIKKLRADRNITQAELARKLKITRATVSSWEMDLSMPSTALIVDLAHFFNVSSDYLLGINMTSTIDVSDLTDEELSLIHKLVAHFKSQKNISCK